HAAATPDGAAPASGGPVSAPEQRVPDQRGPAAQQIPAQQVPAQQVPAQPGPHATADVLEPAGGAPAGRWELLTAREREAAGLVAKGLTNRDIAARLVVSKRTVDAHLEHILSKLGYSSRVQVAALANRAERPTPLSAWLINHGCAEKDLNV